MGEPRRLGPAGVEGGGAVRRLSGFGAFVRRGGAPKGLQGGNGAGGVTAHRPRGGTAPPEGSRRGLGWDGGGFGPSLPVSHGRDLGTAAIWGRPLSAASAERSGAAPGENKWSAVGFSFSSSKSFFSFSFS